MNVAHGIVLLLGVSLIVGWGGLFVVFGLRLRREGRSWGVLSAVFVRGTTQLAVGLLLIVAGLGGPTRLAGVVASVAIVASRVSLFVLRRRKWHEAPSERPG